MTLNIKISHKDIVEKNIDNVKKSMDVIVEDPEMIKAYENGISFNFIDDEQYDLIKKFLHPEYKAWFRLLDNEFPSMPYFLSTKTHNTLLFFLMGVLDYQDKGDSITFEAVSAGRFFRKKTHEIKNLCLSNNIDPHASVERLALLLNEKEDINDSEKLQKREAPIITENAEPESESIRDTQVKKGMEIPALLKKYGSIAVLTGSGQVRLILLLKEVFKDGMRLKANHFMYDESKKLGYFVTTFEVDSSEIEIRSILLYNPQSAASIIQKNGGVKIEGMTKNSNGVLVKAFEFNTLVPVSFPEKKELPIEETVETSSFKEEESQVALLKEENTSLKKEVENLKNVIEVLEEQAMQHSGISGFFRKFFK